MASLLLDESILPGCSSEQSDRRCVPGDKLFDSSEDYNAVNGCYEYHGSIYASLAGFVHVFSSTDEKDFTKNIVEVRNSFDEKGNTIPSPGSIVTARVEAITLKFAKCAIICVGETLLNHEFNSTLRKEDVRDKEKDKVELYKFVQPGDIILARVLGYGDSQTAYLLTIAEDELGVISGRGQNGILLISRSKSVEFEKVSPKSFNHPTLSIKKRLNVEIKPLFTILSCSDKKYNCFINNPSMISEIGDPNFSQFAVVNYNFVSLGERLVPFSTTVMKGMKSEYRELRKVALLPNFAP